MFESPIESQRPSGEPHHIPPEGIEGQEGMKEMADMVDHATSKTRAAVVGAKDAVVQTVSNQGGLALDKMKEGAQTMQGTAREYFYILAVACLAIGFVVGLLFGMARQERSIVVHKGWRPWE